MANKNYSSKKAILLAMSCILLPYSLLQQSVYAQSDKTQTQKSLQEVEQRLQALTKELNRSKANQKTARDKLAQAEQELSRTNKAMKQISAESKSLEANLKGLNQAIQYQEKQLKEGKEALSSLILSRFKSGEADYIKMILNQENPYAVGRLSNYHQFYREAFLEKVESISKESNDLAKQRIAQQQHQADLQAKREQLNELSQEQHSKKKERAKHLSEINKQVSSKQTKLKRLKENKKRLNQLLAALREQERILQEQARRRAEQEKSKPTTARSRPIRLPVEGGFKKQQGRLRMPIQAKIKTKYGDRIDASGISSEGLYFATKFNQSVNSIFRGRVLFADYLKGYGLLIIIDHGDEHISLYGHNESLLKKVGDMVETNEAIATSGNSGGMKTPTLYFEIRHNTNTVDPRKWCQP